VCEGTVTIAQQLERITSDLVRTDRPRAAQNRLERLKARSIARLAAKQVCELKAVLKRHTKQGYDMRRAFEKKACANFVCSEEDQKQRARLRTLIGELNIDAMATKANENDERNFNLSLYAPATQRKIRAACAAKRRGDAIADRLSNCGKHSDAWLDDRSVRSALSGGARRSRVAKRKTKRTTKKKRRSSPRRSRSRMSAKCASMSPVERRRFKRGGPRVRAACYAVGATKKVKNGERTEKWRVTKDSLGRRRWKKL